MTQREIQHLYLRAGFGASLDMVRTAAGLDRRQIVDRLYSDSAHPTPLDAIRMPTGEEVQMAMSKDKTPEEKKMIREYSRDESRKLNLAFLGRLASGREMLNERMTFFWHDHFACKDDHPVHAQYLNNTIRKYAMGDFRQLLLAVSKEPAMLKFLNNQQNKKNAPNENFAREVMELFTLGRGHYTEADIKNGARAFTGWGFDNVKVAFVFRERQHDYDQKTFLGQTGNFDGDDIIRIITEQKQCALYITDKIYRYFVNEKGNDARVAELADGFYTSGYDIGGLMQQVFLADWFYEEANVGTRIKSPIELMAGLGRQFDPSFPHPQILLLVQRVLGQSLFDPPNVAGWPNGQEWIDSSSLIFRTNLGKKIMDSSEIDVMPKPDDDRNPNEMQKREKRFELIEAQIDWSKIAGEIEASDDHGMISALSTWLLQMDIPQTLSAKMEVIGATKEEKLKHICSQLTAMPEYQLC